MRPPRSQPLFFSQPHPTTSSDPISRLGFRPSRDPGLRSGRLGCGHGRLATFGIRATDLGLGGEDDAAGRDLEVVHGDDDREVARVVCTDHSSFWVDCEFRSQAATPIVISQRPEEETSDGEEATNLEAPTLDVAIVGDFCTKPETKAEQASLAVEAGNCEVIVRERDSFVRGGRDLAGELRLIRKGAAPVSTQQEVDPSYLGKAICPDRFVMVFVEGTNTRSMAHHVFNGMRLKPGHPIHGVSVGFGRVDPCVQCHVLDQPRMLVIVGRPPPKPPPSRIDGVVDQYSVLITFDVQSSTDRFYKHFNGRRFSSLEVDVCRVCYMIDVHHTRLIEHDSSSVPSSAEQPNCPVCLETLDKGPGGIFTTICNHSFHCSCISKWTDSSCPVCGYCQQQPEKYMCSMGCTSENLWICVSVVLLAVEGTRVMYQFVSTLQIRVFVYLQAQVFRHVFYGRLLQAKSAHSWELETWVSCSLLFWHSGFLVSFRFYNTVRHDLSEVRASNPVYAYLFFKMNGIQACSASGGCALCITRDEEMSANLEHLSDKLLHELDFKFHLTMSCVHFICSSTGAWLSILQLRAVMAICTNCLLLVGLDAI